MKVVTFLLIFLTGNVHLAKIPYPTGGAALPHPSRTDNQYNEEIVQLSDTRNAMDLIIEANTKSGVVDRLIEGDIVPVRKRNGVNVNAWKWYDHKIAYVIDESGFNNNQIIMIKEAISQFNRDVSCINFTPRSGDIDYVMIKHGFGCHSSIGRDGGEQAVVLGDNCFYKGVIMHELNHAAGFFHEQSRYDRDKYIQVNWENVQDGKADDFSKQSPNILTLLGTTYDYGSIMHYGPKTFSKNGKPVLVPRYDSHGLMGQRDGFSKIDIWKLNFMYGCVSGDPPMPEWMLYGMTTPPQPTLSTATTTRQQTTSTFKTFASTSTIAATPVRTTPTKSTSTPKTTTTSLASPSSSNKVLITETRTMSHHVSTSSMATTEVPVVSTKPTLSSKSTMPQVSTTSTKPTFTKKATTPLPKATSTQSTQESTSTTILPKPSTHASKHANQATTLPNKQTTTAQTKTTTVKCSEATLSSLPLGIVAAPPNFNVAVFPGSLRFYWDRPCSANQIQAYVLTYLQGSSHEAHQIMIHPNKLTHYIATSSHPGHKYQISAATMTKYGKGPSSPTIITYSACGNDVTLPENGVYDLIHSPYFSQNYYEPDTACQWTIRAPAGQRLKVNFNTLNLIGTDACDNDVIIVNDETYCNKKPANGYIYTKGSSAKIVFVSRAGIGNKPGGFKLTVSVDDTKPKQTGIISTPGLIHLTWTPPDNHSTDFHYVLKYRLVPEETVIAITLDSDVTSWTIPTNINFGRIYEIEISPVVDGEMGKGTVYQARAACERNITVTRSGTIYFPHQGSTYTPDTECQWNLLVHQDHYLTLNFDELDLEVSEGCTNDFVEITGVGKLCSNNQTQHTLESHSVVTKVRFVSNNEEEGRGFRLRYNLV